jgi:hypothetical protein
LIGHCNKTVEINQQVRLAHAYLSVVINLLKFRAVRMAHVQYSIAVLAPKVARFANAFTVRCKIGIYLRLAIDVAARTSAQTTDGELKY